MKYIHFFSDQMPLMRIDFFVNYQIKSCNGSTSFISWYAYMKLVKYTWVYPCLQISYSCPPGHRRKNKTLTREVRQQWNLLLFSSIFSPLDGRPSGDVSFEIKGADTRDSSPVEGNSTIPKVLPLWWWNPKSAES